MKQSIVLVFLAISLAVAVQQPSPMEVFLMGYRYGLAAAKQSVFGSIDTQVPQPVSRSSKINSAASRASFRSIDDDALESSGVPFFTMDGSPSGKRYRQLSSAAIPLRREETLMFRKTFPENMYPNADFVSYGTNCDFSAETPLYIVQNVTDPIKCGSHFCYGDRRCTHFAHHYNTNLCRIISSFGSGSSLVSRVTDIQAGFVCGLIPNRACNPNSSLQKCITLDV